MRRHDDTTPTSTFAAALDDAHSAVALLAGTVVAAPVLLAALGGRQDVSTALALYAAAIAGCWMVVGVIAGALSLTGATVEFEPGDAPVGDGEPERVESSR